jgi:hypothetical protein
MRRTSCLLGALLLLSGCSRPALTGPGGEAPARSSWTWEGQRSWNWDDLAVARAPSDGPAGGAGPDEAEPEEDVARPLFTLSANGTGSLQLFQGWPLVLEGRLLHRQAFTRGQKIQPLVISAAEGAWPTAATVATARGEKSAWPFHLATTGAEAVLALDNKTAGLVGWWLAPEETMKLPAGDYELAAVLDTTASTRAGAWKGKVQTDPVHIQVAPEPATLSPRQEEDKHLLLAHLAGLRGDVKGALAQVEALLARQPNSPAGLELKADLRAADGQTAEALGLYDRALAAWLKQNPRAKEPPSALLRKHRDVLYQFLSK